jgi:hypothetical protein
MFLKFGCVDHIASCGLSMALGTIVPSFLRRPYDRPPTLQRTTILPTSISLVRLFSICHGIPPDAFGWNSKS